MCKGSNIKLVMKGNKKKINHKYKYRLEPEL